MKSSAELLNLLRRLYVHGVIVEVTARGTLGLKGYPCPDDLKAELREYRDDVLELLQRQGIGKSSESGARMQYAVPCGIETCRILGPCGHFLTLRSCGLVTIADTDQMLESAEENGRAISHGVTYHLSRFALPAADAQEDRAA